MRPHMSVFAGRHLMRSSRHLEPDFVLLVGCGSLSACVRACVRAYCLLRSDAPVSDPRINGCWRLRFTSKSKFDISNPLGSRVDGTKPGLEGLFGSSAATEASSSPIQRAVTSSSYKQDSGVRCALRLALHAALSPPLVGHRTRSLSTGYSMGWPPADRRACVGRTRCMRMFGGVGVLSGGWAGGQGSPPQHGQGAGGRTAQRGSDPGGPMDLD